jgi:hypothetical protein
VQLLAPVLHPPAVRVFEDESSFAFSNPAAIRGPGSEVAAPHRPSDNLSQDELWLLPRVAAVVGHEGALGGFTIVAEWRDPRRPEPKDRDFALGLGPYVVTPDAVDLSAVEVAARVDAEERLRAHAPVFDWDAARRLAADGTALYPGDLLASPSLGRIEGVGPGCEVEIEIAGLGTLRQTVLGEFEA